MAPARSAGRQDRRARATPSSPPPSGGSMAWSASTPWPAPRRSWSSPTRNNNPDWIAADLLSQAEHDPAAQSILITDDDAFAQCASRPPSQDQLSATGPPAPDAAGVVARPRCGGDRPAGRQAPGLVDRIAPEHVEFAIEEPERLADQVRHAGAIFLGRYAPEAIGDYVAGSNHVLPTSRAARFSVRPLPLRFPQAHLGGEVRRAGVRASWARTTRGPGHRRGPAGPRPDRPAIRLSSNRLPSEP
jgi:hypothetical protein